MEMFCNQMVELLIQFVFHISILVLHFDSDLCMTKEVSKYCHNIDIRFA